MRRLFVGLVLCCATLSYFASTASAGETKLKAPDFSAPDIDGKKVELKSLLGQGPILVSFWATSCKPCIKELDELQKLYPEYQKKGFEILAIDVDGPRSVSAVKSKVKGLKWQFPVLLDTNKDIYRKYQVLGIPHTALIDQKGDIRYTHTTYRSGDEKIIQKKIDELFEEQKEASGQEQGGNSGK
jgi:cytochrome c biogenesis protein CcmG/thiol:disulfide interchange protein DsbE